MQINLGVGAYRDDNGQPFVLECVRRAEAALTGAHNHEYAGIGGIAKFTEVRCFAREKRGGGGCALVSGWLLACSRVAPEARSWQLHLLIHSPPSPSFPPLP